MRFRSLATLGVALALAGTAACTDNSGPNGRISGGLFALTSVNGYGLPYSYQNNGSTTTLQSDVYTLDNNGTYSEVIQETVSTGFGSSPRTDNEQGTWTQNGNSITFSPTYSTYAPALQQYVASIQSNNGGLLGGGNVLVISSSQGEQLVYQQE